MLKKVLVISGIVLLLGTIIFGFETGVGYLEGIKRSIKNTISLRTPTKLDVARIEVILESEKKKIGKFSGKIRDLEDKLTAENQKIEQLQKSSDEQKEALKIAYVLLKEGKREYSINKRNYSKFQIEEDVVKRISFVETLKNKRDFSSSLVNTLQSTLDNCKKNLIIVNQNFAAKKLEFNKLKIREIDAEIKQRAAALSKSIVGLSDGLMKTSELQSAMDIYKKKIRDKEKEFDRITNNNNSLINYSPEEEPIALMEQLEKIIK